jgi:hypothetical protein
MVFNDLLAFYGTYLFSSHDIAAILIVTDGSM